MIYGLVISAGKQSRFESEIPKALMQYNGQRLLDLNLKHLNGVCDKTFVVVSPANEKYFRDYDHITIESGNGCGDAVMRALNRLPLTMVDTVFIQWGDTLQTPILYNTLVDVYDGSWLIPCVKEDAPYVQIKQEGDFVQAIFSKYGEHTHSGFHDLSVFYGPAVKMRTALRSFASKYVSCGSTQYKHPHGNELQFLDVFNEEPIYARVVEFKDYRDFSFNTLEQYNNLIKVD